MRRRLRTLLDQFRAKAAIRRRRSNDAIHRRMTSPHRDSLREPIDLHEQVLPGTRNPRGRDGPHL